MYLEELVIDSFKSFGERTHIPLRDDFTAITGPNGSGKSNILDAIQFALGLGRVSDVRARRLTDLIHHVDEREPELPREAEVSVVINNEERTLSTEQIAAAVGDEVLDPDRLTVRRRIRQTENNTYSYYYIDDTRVNLGDIRELMGQAGVSDERYNIVPQGDITELINLTPMQRRRIIDEIAGVAEFDHKKEQAEAELETVRERIDEVELRVEEKATTLEQLADERDEALAYRQLSDQKDQYERYQQVAELEDRRAELETVTERIDELEDELAEERAALAEAEERATRIEEDIEDLTAEIERTGGERQRELRSDIEDMRGEIGQLEGRIEEKRERIEELRSERRDAELRHDQQEEHLEDITGERETLTVRKADVAGDLLDRRGELAEVEAAIDDLGAEQRRLNERLRRRERLLGSANATRNDLQRAVDRLNDEARRRDRERDELEGTIDDLEDTLAERREDRDALDREMQRCRDDRGECQATVEELVDRRDTLQSEIDEVDADIEEAEGRLADLRRQQREAGHGQFPAAVARVLGSDIDGVHGAVATLGDVPDEDHAVACEAAGGGRLANVIVDDSGVGQSCIEYLKDRDAGRATFLPLSEFDERSLPARPDHPGVVDFARNLVSYDDRYVGVFSYVLGSTLVVEDMDVARDLTGEFRMVTLEGDVVERSGAMRGGSGRESPYRFGGSRGRLERLAQRIDDLEGRLDDLTDEHTSVTDELAEVRERDRSLRDELRDLEGDRATVTDRIDQLSGQLATKRERLADIEDERAETRERIQELQPQLAAVAAAVEAHEVAIEDLKDALADTALGELTDRREELQAAIEDLQERHDDLDEEVADADREIEATRERIDDLEDEVEAASAAIEARSAEIDALEDDIEDIEATIEERQAAIDELEDELVTLRGEREGRREDLGEARELVNETRRTVAELERELEPARGQQEQLSWEIDELAESVEPIADDEEVPDLEAVTDRIEALEERMAEMEPINHKAVDQYDRLADEVESLQADVDELESEREAIIERIESYEAEKREAFMEAYTAIDEEYRDVFRTLSGGSAELELEDEDDPFEGGLIMRAQPEDKVVASLQQLSGGEKSLTALSLIFAIQRYRPAPFYALDEIDAFLDAANLDRIGDMLEAHRGDGQFIVISHHADLLERADRIIGVSLPEDTGASQVSGINLASGAPADD